MKSIYFLIILYSNYLLAHIQVIKTRVIGQMRLLAIIYMSDYAVIRLFGFM